MKPLALLMSPTYASLTPGAWGGPQSVDTVTDIDVPDCVTQHLTTGPVCDIRGGDYELQGNGRSRLPHHHQLAEIPRQLTEAIDNNDIKGIYEGLSALDMEDPLIAQLFQVECDKVKYVSKLSPTACLIIYFKFIAHLKKYDPNNANEIIFYMRGMVVRELHNSGDDFLDIHSQILRHFAFLTDLDLGNFFPALSKAFRSEQEPLVQVFILRFMRRWLYEYQWRLKHLPETVHRDDLVKARMRDRLRRLARLGLQSNEPLVVDTARRILAQHLPRSLSSAEAGKLWDRSSALFQVNPRDKVWRYLYSVGLRALPRGNVLMGSISHLETEVVERPLTAVRPIHSLADYQPNPHLRADKMAEKYTALKELVATPDATREFIIHKFFANGDGFERIPIVHFGAGAHYLLDGHHRTAAFIKAALDGVIPLDWLEQPIPFLLYDYKDQTSAPWDRYALLLGVELSWQDLFPAGTDFYGIEGFMRRGFKKDQNESSDIV